MAHHQVNQYTHYGNSKEAEQEKQVESLFRKIMTENFPNQEKK